MPGTEPQQHMLLLPGMVRSPHLMKRILGRLPDHPLQDLQPDLHRQAQLAQSLATNLPIDLHGCTGD